MSTEQTPDTSRPRGETIAEGNVERLLTAAYRPEAPSEDFARRLHAAAQARATTRKERTAMPEMAGHGDAETRSRRDAMLVGASRRPWHSRRLSR